MPILNEAAKVDAPVSGTVIQLDVSATGARYVIPDSFRGMYTKWVVNSDNFTDPIAVDVMFGTVAVTVTYNTDSTVDGSGNITVATASVGGRITNLTGPQPWVIPSDPTITHFFIDGSTDGKLQIVIE